MAYEYREISREGYRDEKGYNYYTRRFQVITDVFDASPGNVAAAIPLAMYASYSAGGETYLPAILKTKTAR